MLSTSRWFVGSSRSRRSGSPARDACQRRARQLAARERVQEAVEVSVREAQAPHDAGRPVAPGVAARVLEPRLGVGVAPERRLVVVAACHRLLERPQLLLQRDQVGGAGEDVLAQCQPLLERRALVVQRDARAFGEHELAALHRQLAREHPEQRRLAGPVGAGEREPVSAFDLERDAVEERVSRELLAELICDHDCHGCSKKMGAAVSSGPRSDTSGGFGRGAYLLGWMPVARSATSPTLARRFPTGLGDTPLPAGTSTART